MSTFSTATYTFPAGHGESAGKTVAGDVVKIGKSYADIKWRDSGRVERVRFAVPDGVVFKA